MKVESNMPMQRTVENGCWKCLAVFASALLLALASNAFAAGKAAVGLPKYTEAQLANFSWNGSSLEDPVAKAKAEKAAKVKTAAIAKAKQRRVAAARALASRKPASIEAPESEITVSDISASFETMLNDRAKVERNPAAFTAMARVIGVRRDLGLTDADSYKAVRDIVLNGGTGAGLSEGMVLTVMRRIPVIDPYQANQQSELEVEFAKVKIVQAQADVAVARLESMDAIDAGLAVGTRAVLVGDFVTTSRR